MGKSTESGNVLFLVFIAVILFAGLSYVGSQSLRNEGQNTAKEEQDLRDGVLQSYQAAINTGKLRLKMVKGCNSIDYSRPADWGAENKDCHLFHPSGGGVSWQDLGMGECKISGQLLTDLEVGESCGEIIYAGALGGTRIYTAPADGNSPDTDAWSTVYSNSPATSNANGLKNTDDLIAASETDYPAASFCRAMGQNWYLPAINELALLFSNRNVGDLAGSFSDSWYWSSTEFDNSRAWRHKFSDGGGDAILDKNSTRDIRCVMQEL